MELGDGTDLESRVGGDTFEHHAVDGIPAAEVQPAAIGQLGNAAVDPRQLGAGATAGEGRRWTACTGIGPGDHAIPADMDGRAAVAGADGICG